MAKKNLKVELEIPVSEPQDKSEVDAAEAAGMTVAALRLHLAAGVFPPDLGPVERYQELATSRGEVAAALGVHERTVATWKTAGMPMAGNKYPIACIRHWRLREHRDAPEWLIRGNKDLPAASASGDLSRAIFRVYRSHIHEAGRRVLLDFDKALGAKIIDQSDPSQVSDMVGTLLMKHFEVMLLTDKQIEELLVEAWGIV